MYIYIYLVSSDKTQALIIYGYIIIWGYKIRMYSSKQLYLFV